MTKKRNIIIMLVVLVLLVGAVLAVNYFVQDQEDTDISDTQSIEIFKVERDQIVQVSANVKGEEFTFVKDGDNWMLKDRPDVKLKNSTVSLFVSEFASVSGEQKIADSADDLSIYGLAQPQGFYTVDLADGTQKQFSVGNSDPISGSYYFKMGDDPAVYTIYSTKADTLLKPLSDYRDTTFLTVNPENLSYVFIQNAANTIELVLETTGEGDDQVSEWNMRQPMQRAIDSQRFSENIMEPVSSLSIQSFVEDGQDHGVGNPAATVTLSDTDGVSQTMYIGDTDADGNRYVRLDGSNTVYLIAGDNLEFINVDPFLLMDKFLNLENIDNVNSIDVISSAATYTLSITREGETETYRVGDLETVEDTFKELYQKVIGLTASGMIEAQPAGSPVVTVVYHLVDGTTETLQFLDYDDRNYAAVIDGVCEFRILKKDVENMLTAVQDVAAGVVQEE